MTVAICEWLLGDDDIAGALDARLDALFGLVPTFEAGKGHKENQAVRALEVGTDWWASLRARADSSTSEGCSSELPRQLTSGRRARTTTGDGCRSRGSGTRRRCTRSVRFPEEEWRGLYPRTKREYRDYQRIAQDLAVGILQHGNVAGTPRALARGLRVSRALAETFVNGATLVTDAIMLAGTRS